MTLSNKKANCGDQIDRISDFPSNVIDGILEHLNIRDRARTSILSKKWRYIWTSFPRLEFDKEFFDLYDGDSDQEDFVDHKPNISRFITEVLLLHNGPIYKFTLFMHRHFNIKIEFLVKWILFLSRKGVKHIQLVNNTYHSYRMPSHLFSCQELTHVRIRHFNMSVPPNFRGFKSLLHLHLEQIKFELGALESLISGCPLLEELCILNCSGYECVDLSASPTLKVFHIEYNHAIKSICLEKANSLIDLTLIVYRDGVSGLNNILPKVQRLTMGLDSKMLYADVIHPTPLICLKYLKLSTVNLEQREELLHIVSVLKSASNLVELVMETCCDKDYKTEVPDHAEELDCSSYCLNQLLTVNIKVKTNFKHVMSLIRFILANSSSLKTLTLDIDLGYKKSDVPILFGISRDLLWMERASQRAHVEVLHQRIDYDFKDYRYY
ncbi:F-box/FBD/LRR-repeat protein At1g13570-like [Trifolium pratense]|uniref:F-box/FBD/LRR-repeat protein At1g13570-like n=1 Tax=Trifolium pratense TaxID=57577 RepID=UPI001E692B37|nr:F-box/FBD/LRR-repeat protein At1g13570-like [Trifolium pratense]